MKIIGQRFEKSPEEYALEEAKLISDVEKLRPYKKPKGIILKFQTWADLDKFNIERAAKKI